MDKLEHAAVYPCGGTAQFYAGRREFEPQTLNGYGCDNAKRLEARLNVHLLQHDTPRQPRLDGEAYYQRCLRILADVEDAEMAFAERNPKGCCGWMRTGHTGTTFLIARPAGFSGAVS